MRPKKSQDPLTADARGHTNHRASFRKLYLTIARLGAVQSVVARPSWRGRGGSGVGRSVRREEK